MALSVSDDLILIMKCQSGGQLVYKRPHMKGHNLIPHRDPRQRVCRGWLATLAIHGWMHGNQRRGGVVIWDLSCPGKYRSQLRVDNRHLVVEAVFPILVPHWTEDLSMEKKEGISSESRIWHSESITSSFLGHVSTSLLLLWPAVHLRLCQLSHIVSNFSRRVQVRHLCLNPSHEGSQC